MSEAKAREQLEAMSAGMVALIDQLDASLAEFAAVVGDLFRRLQEQGFERAEALRLVEVCAAPHFERAPKQEEED